MIKQFPLKRTAHYYIVDAESYVYETSVTANSSIFGVEIKGTFLTDYFHAEDKEIFLKRLRLSFTKVSEVCTVRVGTRLFLCKLQKISDQRVKVTRWDITGMGIEAVNLV